MLSYKQKVKYIVTSIVLVLLVIGASTGFYLSQQNQDIRQHMEVSVFLVMM